MILGINKLQSRCNEYNFNYNFFLCKVLINIWGILFFKTCALKSVGIYNMKFKATK